MTLSPLEVSDPRVVAGENVTALAYFLGFTPNLRTLDIHLYATLYWFSAHYDNVFKAVADNAHLPLLENCTIHGGSASETCLLKFLGNHPHITNLELKKVSLMSVSWRLGLRHISKQHAREEIAPVEHRLKGIETESNSCLGKESHASDEAIQQRSSFYRSSRFR